jgi:hypothetical protein
MTYPTSTLKLQTMLARLVVVATHMETHLQSYSPVLKSAGLDRGNFGFLQFFHVLYSRAATTGVQEFVLQLFHPDRGEAPDRCR